MCLLPFRMRVFELRSTFIFIIGILFIIFCVIFHIFVFELKILLEINEGKKYRIFFFNTLILFRKKIVLFLTIFFLPPLFSHELALLARHKKWCDISLEFHRWKVAFNLPAQSRFCISMIKPRKSFYGQEESLRLLIKRFLLVLRWESIDGQDKGRLHVSFSCTYWLLFCKELKGIDRTDESISTVTKIH